MTSTVRTFVISSTIGAAMAALFAAALLNAESPSPADQQIARDARVAAAEKAWQERQNREIEQQSVQNCYTAILGRVSFPSKAAFGLYEMREVSEGRYVYGIVDLMNGFGAMIPHRYSCYSDGSTFEVSLTQGG